MVKKLLLVLFPILVIVGCDDSAVEIDKNQIPSSNVSFADHLMPVLEVHCVPCHNGSDMAGGLSLTSYSQVTVDPSIVFPGEPQNSRLMWVIDPEYGNVTMPPIESPYKRLNQNQLDGIETWIKEGAKNN